MTSTNMTSINARQSAAAGDGAAQTAEYQVLLIRDDSVEYRYGVFCPELPGCASDGRTRAEALWMIKDAIALYKSVFGADDDVSLVDPPPVPIRQLADEYAAAGFPVEITAVSVELE